MTTTPRTLADTPRERRPVLEDISIVIPTLGRPILESCLAYIADADVWPARLIVVDQSSSAFVAGLLEALESRGMSTVCVASNQRGRSAGVNRGLERVQTTFLAVTDDDCFVECDWLQAMRDRLSAKPMTIVSGRVDAAGDEAVVAIVSGEEATTQDRPRLRFDAMSGGNMGTSRAVIDLVGPFDEDPRIQCAEDCDWSYRALRLGIPISYAPEVRLTHYGWRDAGFREKQYRAYARSHGGFYGKYIRRCDWFIALRAALHLLRVAYKWFLGLISRDRERTLRAKAYLTGLPIGILAGMRKQDELQAGRAFGEPRDDHPRHH
jgi:GT2 family glycosyltransferase